MTADKLGSSPTADISDLRCETKAKSSRMSAQMRERDVRSVKTESACPSLAERNELSTNSMEVLESSPSSSCVSVEGFSRASMDSPPQSMPSDDIAGSDGILAAKLVVSAASTVKIVFPFSIRERRAGKDVDVDAEA